MKLKPKIYIAGHRGMVGSAILRVLLAQGWPEDRIVYRTRTDLDLTNQDSVRAFFENEEPDQVYLAAAKVGGIFANNEFPADFLRDNLLIQTNVVDSAFRVGVKKLLFLGSSCIYPKFAKQPIQEEELLTGTLEPTNEPYAIAKIAGIKLCESYNRQYGHSHGVDYRSVMPSNLYGIGDNYHSEYSHVIPALIRRFHEAKINGYSEVKIWGSGLPLREFLYVDDMAKAALHVMNLPSEMYKYQTKPMLSHINIGSGSDIAIGALAETIAKIVGYIGMITFDSTKPDGPPKKLMDSARIKSLGWSPSISLEEGLRLAYSDFLLNSQRRNSI